MAFAPLKIDPAGQTERGFAFLEPPNAPPPPSRRAGRSPDSDLTMVTFLGFAWVSVAQLNAIAAQLTTLTAKVTAMSAQLDALSANVDALIASAEAETTLLTSVKAALDAAIAAGNDAAQLQALSDKLAAEVAKVNAAIAANTPAAAPATP